MHCISRLRPIPGTLSPLIFYSAPLCDEARFPLAVDQRQEHLGFYYRFLDLVDAINGPLMRF